MGDARATIPAQQFDAWLGQAVSLPGAERDDMLEHWQEAPAARICHPRPEHLLAVDGCSRRFGPAPGRRIFNELVLETMISGFEFA